MELSMKVIEIRQEFEISLDNAFRDSRDDLVPQLKKDLRDHVAELLRINDDRRKKVAVNMEERLVQRIGIIARHDYNSTYYIIRKIAEIESKIGNDMILLFEQFMRDLSPDRVKLRELQDFVDQSERKRNRTSRDALDVLDKEKFRLPEKTGSRDLQNNDVLQQARLFLSNDIISKTHLKIRLFILFLTV